MWTILWCFFLRFRRAVKKTREEREKPETIKNIIPINYIRTTIYGFCICFSFWFLRAPACVSSQQQDLLSAFGEEELNKLCEQGMGWEVTSHVDKMVISRFMGCFNDIQVLSNTFKMKPLKILSLRHIASLRYRGVMLRTAARSPAPINWLSGNSFCKQYTL